MKVREENVFENTNILQETQGGCLCFYSTMNLKWAPCARKM